MGAQVDRKDYAPSGHSDMRNFSEDASSSNWPHFYGDRSLTNGQYCNNGFLSRSVMDAYPGYDKDAVKQKMLEHEAIFKNQVIELHRLYRIQRDMMQEVKRKEPNRMSVEPSSSSSIRGSQFPSEDTRKWHMTSLPLAHSNYYARASTCSTEMMNSPLSYVKGNNNVQLQNGFSSRIIEEEELEGRPSKVRKKLFDLQLPADQYIDTDDDQQLHDSSVKLILGGGGEMSGSRKDASRMSNSCVRNVFGLADLNEPAQFEEATTASAVDFLGHSANNPTESKSPNISSSRQLNPVLLASSSREMMWSSLHPSSNGLISNLPMNSKGKERQWGSYGYDTGNMKNGFPPVCQDLEQNKLPMPSHRYNPGIYPSPDMWRERTGYGFERGHENSNFSRVEPPMATSIFSSNPTPFVSSSEFPNMWPPVSSLGKPTNSPTQKSTFFHPIPFMNSQSPVMGRDRWNGAGISNRVVMNTDLANDHPVKNGYFCHGSSSSMSRGEPSARFQPLAFDCLNFNKGDNVLPEQSTTILHQHERRFLAVSNSTDSKSAKGFDLNVMNDPISPRDEELVGGSSSTRKLEDIVPSLPWLRATKPSSSGSRKESSVLVSTSASIIQPSPDEHNRRDDKKNIMIDINMAWDLSSDDLEKGVDGPKATTSIRNDIDLNFCAPDEEEEEEDRVGPSGVTCNNNGRTNAGREIDLEAPAVLDSDEDDEHVEDDNLPPREKRMDEDESIAAEAILAISLLGDDDPSEDPLGKSLHWFADCVFSCTDDVIKDKPDGKDFFKEMDIFEAMTLQLTETKEEDYMPKPFIPEFQYVDNNVGPTSILNRPRRGQARRGRQRRDFQRDILPGLSSLSRHELTEDLQTFGGLMRATGHAWTSPLAMRRNGARNGGGARGRRRAVAVAAAIDAGQPLPPPPPPAIPSSSSGTALTQQFNHIEGVLEDKSLTGWGKTTRRPRRQRYPAGNPPPAFPLTP
ncbi:unnamed protein product [Cuscuta epithymum]|uniref:Uncharacterized protein n=1 Tax=Cuscuta epithymum TaxID=186058 RepID=A0AAV0F0E4_9ASTE|nr:unnamed protein product [Cuscuta epithymum]